ncbi:MAG: hypothetical protein ACM3TN_27995 [Alphaproteobacteria bacterium]
MNYSTILNVIGQKLESLTPIAYEVVCYGHSYLVRCRVKQDPATTKADEKKVRGLASFLRLWREETKPSSQTAEEGAFMNVEFFYDLEDIKKLDEEHQASRSDPNAMPDPYSLSYTLGAVGDLIDRKPKASLLFASNRGQEGQKIVVLYQTERGRTLEEYPISGLYDLWVQQYMKKKN